MIAFLAVILLVHVGLEARAARARRRVLGNPVPLRRAEVESTRLIQSFPKPVPVARGRSQSGAPGSIVFISQ